MRTFSSLNDAIANGFVLAGAREYLAYRDCNIFGFDTSERGLKGLAYGIRVEVPEELTSNYVGVRSEKDFRKSAVVKIVGWSSLDTGGAGRQGGGLVPYRCLSLAPLQRRCGPPKSGLTSCFAPICVTRKFL